jgi:hypothetical protein
MVDYFQLENVAGRYFSCPQYGVMSIKACARNYAEAPAMAASGGRLGSCLQCSIGQLHRDGSAPMTSDKDTARITRGGAVSSRSFCVRCRRASGDSGQRLVGQMRLLRDKTICVSCYNREREIKLGRNAKGTPPIKWASLLSLKLSVVSNGRAEVVELTNLVFDRLESIYTLMRRSRHYGLAVGWTPAMSTITEAAL